MGVWSDVKLTRLYHSQVCPYIIIKYDLSREMRKYTLCALSEDPDESAHAHSRVWGFAKRFIARKVLAAAIGGLGKILSDANAQK